MPLCATLRPNPHRHQRRRAAAQHRIESLFGHVKTDWPHLEKTRDPGELALELDRVRTEYNTVRLHAGIGYVTPDDEHHGRGDTIRRARRDGLAAARQARVTYRRTQARTPS
jgi:transposase InsO family protein